MKVIFAAILSIIALSSKKISIYNEEIIVSSCFILFLFFSRQSFGQTLLLTLDERIKAIQEESEQANLPNEVLPTTSHEEEVNFRIRFNICKTIVESLPTARCTPKCEKTLQALLCQNLNVKSITLENAITSRRIRLHNDIVTGFQKSVSERFLPGTTMTGSPIVELILEGLLVLRIGYKH
nr:ATPase subunit 4 [Acorus tatarinowii]